MSKLADKLSAKRRRTEKHVQRLEKLGKAGQRYTITLPDMPFFVTALICDAGWILAIVAELIYIVLYRFHYEEIDCMIVDIVLFIAFLAIVFGVVMVIRLENSHEKVIATARQLYMSFGAVAIGSFVMVITGIIGSGILKNASGDVPVPVILCIAGGACAFAFELPILISLRKGIYYTDPAGRFRRSRIKPDPEAIAISGRRRKRDAEKVAKEKAEPGPGSENPEEMS